MICKYLGLLILIALSACSHTPENLLTDEPGAVRISVVPGNFVSMRLIPTTLIPFKGEAPGFILGLVKNTKMDKDDISLIVETPGKREILDLLLVIDGQEYEGFSPGKPSFETPGGYKGEKIRHHSIQEIKIKRGTVFNLMKDKNSYIVLYFKDGGVLKAGIYEEASEQLEEKESHFKTCLMKFTSFLASYSL